jgi:TolB-like protein/class 3 adenylate cyclase/Flp pilus assembly protein TadD
MQPDSSSEVKLEIGHVLFIDIVGYSNLLMHEQSEQLRRLNEIIRGAAQVRLAEAEGKLLQLPTGDGGALVFRTSPEAPVLCALEIGKKLKNHPELRVRMGIHSGPVNEISDLKNQANIAGAGINIAQRVMDCGDAGHILLSKHVAEDLEHYARWQPYLHELGECEVKHGRKVSLVNLYDREVGNPAPPQKFEQKQQAEAEIAAAGRKSRTFRSVAVVAGFVACFAIIAFYIFIHRSRPPIVRDKSIAVLPFENFSEDKANAFFADGIQDDILTNLAKIHDIRVISRTSVDGYRGKKGTRNLREIAAALGVSNVLEGSVRREGDRVVVNVQLIDALEDRHLWANSYDRTLRDSLGIEGQLAREIADALSATLTPDEKARVQQKPTDNPRAYDLYLQAREYEFKPDTFLQDYRTAEQLYVQAITLDPMFALAHARLAMTCARIYHFYEPTDSWKKRARAEAAKALELQSNLGEAHHALGLCYYWFARDYLNALSEFAIARTLLPNDSSIAWDIAAIKRRQGRWQETVGDYREILTLDPQNANVVRDLLYVYCAMRDWPNAESLAQRLIALTPDSLNAKAQIGYVEFWSKGTTERLKREMATVPAGQDPDGAVTTFRIDASLIDRDVAAAERMLRASPLDNLSYYNAVDTPRSFFAGEIALLRGDNETARKELERARDIFAASVKEAPNVAERHAFLGLTCAFLGEKDRAIKESGRAVELRPESQDALDGPILNAVLALVYARVGENERAVTLLRHLLSIPGAVDSANYSVTQSDLKSRWEWDPLRGDPGFNSLLTQKSP